jgi:hypothetical protein
MTTGVFPATGVKPAAGGLLDAASVTEHTDSWASWTNGVFGFDTILCPTRLVLADYCTNIDKGIIAETDANVPDVWPFGIITEYECTTLGMKLAERKRIALLQNELGTQKALERELWTADISHASNHLEQPFLADPNHFDVTPVAGAVPVKIGIAALEQALGDCGLGTQGVIHMSRSAASIATQNGTITWENNKLVTGLHTPVVAGVGYTGQEGAPPAQTPIPAPTPPAPMVASQILVATGPVAVHLGPSEIIENGAILNIADNVLTVVAARPAAVYYDGCCTFAVSVDLTL